MGRFLGLDARGQARGMTSPAPAPVSIEPIPGNESLGGFLGIGILDRRTG